ncbi:unnamed protein product [Durusdinium trenchii]|uniref:DNA-(apurinic or apyrimidinic site) endonuclease n=1 Tax=Durusdinium trenchii TaxID=1381693 RepID=A0ABP0SYA5_9DINO
MESSDVHLISWNVAGLKPTLDQLRRFGFANFFRRHRVDILCLQEVKLNSKALATAGRQYEVDGYDSFWACNDGCGNQRQGLNGVCTFVRRGLTLSADNSPLGCPDLDGEGRCLLTDHGSFVLFNAYVPNAAGGPRLPFKLRWLRALKHAMWRERSKGKAVILAGDLNMKHRVLDTHWSCVSVRPEHFKIEESDALPDISKIAALWPDLVSAFKGKTISQIETRNSRNGQTFQKWGVWAKPLTDADAPVRLGPPIEHQGMAEFSFWMDGLHVEEDGQIVTRPTSTSYVLREKGEISIGELLEGMKKLAGVDISTAARDWLMQRSTPSSAEAVRLWLEDVLAGGMVDSFAEFYPKAQGRFTCWDQYRNRRHENEGSRIDYILVDETFFKRHASPGAGLDSRGLDADSPTAALAAATYDGLSQPSPFIGGGVPPLEEDEYIAQFRADKEGPSTGIIYTPQQLSDHVAVSLLLRKVALPSATLSRNAATQRCQPHLSSKRITDFFSRKDTPPLKRQAVAV